MVEEAGLRPTNLPGFSQSLLDQGSIHFVFETPADVVEFLTDEEINPVLYLFVMGDESA